LYETHYSLFHLVYRRAFAGSVLPLYIERTMTRSQMESGGDIISWGWKLRTLYSFWSDYNYFRPEENFFFWLVLNLALACLYALVITLGAAWLLAYRKRRRR